MAKVALVALLIVHGSIHAMGFAKAFGLAELRALTLGVSKPWGIVWLTAAVLFVLAGAARAANAQLWWMMALGACVASQVAIAAHWSDAKFGTAANILVLLAVVGGVGDWMFARSTQALLDRLRRAPATPIDASNAGDRESLPAPVQRYLRTVLGDGHPAIGAVSIEQTGMLNLGEDEEKWAPFRASHRAVPSPVGFVWAASVNMAPGVPVYVHDAYVAGEGILQPMALGLLPLGAKRDRGGDLSQGELIRFLAEAPWYPTVLLPGQGVHWEPIDEHSARATLTNRGVRATLTFTFDNHGLIQSVRADARGRSVGKQIVPTPWEGKWWHYEVREGVRVPLQAEVAWLLPEGRKPYWRGTVTSLHYDPPD